MKNIAVIFGGKSVEHDISIITALQVMKNFPKQFNLIPIYIQNDGKFVYSKDFSLCETFINFDKKHIKKQEITFNFGQGSINFIKNNKTKRIEKIDCALLCNHGHGGEDGSLQGLLELAEIPYTSSKVASSAVTMDKILTKIFLTSENILTPAYVHFCKDEYEKNRDDILKILKEKIKFPCIIKPSRLGSSVGINICENENMLNETIEKAICFDNKIIVEKFIKNAKECALAVIKTNGKYIESEIQQINKDSFYTFEDKYLKNQENRKEKLSKSMANEIKKIGVNVCKLLDTDGVVRVDFLIDENNKIFVNEVNSIPGSLAFNLFKTKFEDLIVCLINDAIKEFSSRQNLNYAYNSNAIEAYSKMSKTIKCSK